MREELIDKTTGAVRELLEEHIVEPITHFSFNVTIESNGLLSYNIHLSGLKRMGQKELSVEGGNNKC